MRKLLGTGLVLAAMLMALPGTGHAAVTLLDQNDWKFQFSGFAELDTIHDSTRSLTEVAGSTPIDRPGTYAGDNGRTQFSLRNSRFAFTALPPVEADWHTKGYLEYDLLGYDPSPNAASGVNESSFFTNPTLRLRHAFLSAEKDGWRILAGQSWTLFGWEPDYVLTTVSVAPVTATMYERTPQVMVVKDFSLNDTDEFQAGISFERPEQRDSEIPNLNAGLRYKTGSRRSGFASANSDTFAQPLSLGLSGTYRNYELPDPTGTSTGTLKYSSAAFAVDTLIPIIASSDGKSLGNTLSFTGEYTQGSGYGDEFPSWTGNLPGFTQATTIPTTNPNLDPGIGGFDGSNNFQLVQMQTWNAQLQYFFADAATYMTAGYGQLLSTNLANLTTSLTAGGKFGYNKADVAFINILHDFTKQVRLGAEYDRFATYYVDNVTAPDNRFQISAWYRF